jgi:hypothetical protein
VLEFASPSEQLEPQKKPRGKRITIEKRQQDLRERQHRPAQTLSHIFNAVARCTVINLNTTNSAQKKGDPKIAFSQNQQREKLPASDFFQRFTDIGQAVYSFHTSILQSSKLLGSSTFTTRDNRAGMAACPLER